ncbi:MAG: hypothetical protein K8T20_14780 [Planctomycetes bacterium]|nr:hypothetical protein [Planctomycetota bacterium]
MPERNIVLRFVDAESGKLMGEHPVPAAQVPETFAVATTLDIGADRFEVVSAEPVLRSEAEARGFMTLRLRRVEIRKVDPQVLLCSLPSIANELPALRERNPAVEKRILTIHEDDWRQVELLSPAAAELAAGDLASITDIHRRERIGSGFRKLHVRKAVDEPLAGMAVSLDGLTKALHAAPLDGLAFEGVDGLVEDGFALAGPGGIVAYGRAAGGRVREIGFLRAPEAPVVAGKWFDLASWIGGQRLLLVDWCRVRTAGQVADVQALLQDLWPVAEQSPGRIFLGLAKS